MFSDDSDPFHVAVLFVLKSIELKTFECEFALRLLPSAPLRSSARPTGRGTSALRCSRPSLAGRVLRCLVKQVNGRSIRSLALFRDAARSAPSVEQVFDVETRSLHSSTEITRGAAVQSKSTRNLNYARLWGDMPAFA